MKVKNTVPEDDIVLYSTFKAYIVSIVRKVQNSYAAKVLKHSRMNGPTNLYKNISFLNQRSTTPNSRLSRTVVMLPSSNQTAESMMPYSTIKIKLEPAVEIVYINFIKPMSMGFRGVIILNIMMLGSIVNDNWKPETWIRQLYTPQGLRNTSFLKYFGTPN